MNLLQPVMELVMELTAGAFAGACLYIATVQQPARLALAEIAAIEDFRAAIPRAERLQAPLLIGCLAAAGAVLATDFSWPVAVGTALLLVVLVQTVLTVLPVNRRLLAGDASDHLDQADVLIARWGRLHWLRTVVAVGGAIALLA